MIRVLAALAAGLALSFAPGARAADEASVTIIHAGVLIAAPGDERPRSQVSVIVQDGRISAIEDGFVTGDGADIVDLSDRWVLPGFIDSHVHITSQQGPDRRLSVFTDSSADRALQGAQYARRTLMAGFTTVQDVGADMEAIRALQRAIGEGLVSGPRLRIAGGAVTPTGGHGDINGWSVEVLRSQGSPYACNGADDCARAVRQLVQEGADMIKITATGGVLSSTGAGVELQFFEEELAAIVEAARMMGRRVTAHAHGVSGVNAFLRAGGHSIEHGTFLDAESIRLFRRNNAVLVPTAMAGEWVTLQADSGWMTPFQRAKALEVGPRMLDMVRQAHRGGVTIAFGTDSGVSAHGDNAREFELYVEAGMTPMEALRTATITAARHLGLEEETGRIAPGLAADIIALDADPLEDISAVWQVGFVMANGRIHKAP
ncbi:amidohydrolase family protein [Alkalicaulis satelles]|uniref:Amidohydrolase family protein n=1 Tax=Alkalicaulis satelles TaxID=2609175 RepID=A0A5M6ZCZ6_9PROT|nr:amidohydrolase family protein [Alkalicaulis satelles]KAA5802185.1 amidohydrolase family protein [Alkalicaulis satelles]